MNYNDMVQKVQTYSGLTETESETSLRSFIKMLTSRMTPPERTDFVSELPQEIQDDAASSANQTDLSMADMITRIAEEQQVDMSSAKDRIAASWKTLKELLPAKGYDTLRNKLPGDILTDLSSLVT